MLKRRGFGVVPLGLGTRLYSHSVATWDDVRRIALALPEVVEEISGHDGKPGWRVRDKAFAWERPLRKRDLAELGNAAPDGPVLGVRVPDLGVKDALTAGSPDVYFTTAHFDGYPAVLVRLDAAEVSELEELITDAWLDRAPKRLARAYLDEHTASP